MPKKNREPELDYKDDILKPMRDLKIGQEYVWIMGMFPMLVRYTGPGKKEFMYNFEFLGDRKGNHDLSIRDVKDYIKFKIDEGIRMNPQTTKNLRGSTQTKLRKLIERLIREESRFTYIISDYQAELFHMDFDELKQEANDEYGFSKWKDGTDYNWIIARGDDFPNSIEILNRKMLADSQVKEFIYDMKRK